LLLQVSLLTGPPGPIRWPPLPTVAPKSGQTQLRPPTSSFFSRVWRAPAVSAQALLNRKVPWPNTACDDNVRSGWMNDIAQATSVGLTGLTMIGPVLPVTGVCEMSMSNRMRLSSLIENSPAIHWKAPSSVDFRFSSWVLLSKRDHSVRCSCLKPGVTPASLSLALVRDMLLMLPM
jgi:hypothetical protein